MRTVREGQFSKAPLVRKHAGAVSTTGAGTEARAAGGTPMGTGILEAFCAKEAQKRQQWRKHCARSHHRTMPRSPLGHTSNLRVELIDSPHGRRSLCLIPTFGGGKESIDKNCGRLACVSAAAAAAHPAAISALRSVCFLSWLARFAAR